MIGAGAEHDGLDPDPQGEILHIDPSSFAAAPGDIVASAQSLSPKDEVFGRVTAEDGTEHEVTDGSHEFSPAETAGKLWMRLRDGIEGHERALAIGAAGTLVSVAAALAIKKTLSVRKKS